MKIAGFWYNSNISLKHKIVGCILLFFAVCYWIGVIVTFFGNASLSEAFVSMLLLVFIAIAFTAFAILFLSGIMARLRKRPIWHWIFGIVFSIWAVGCFGSITTIDGDLLTLIMLLIIGSVCSIISILYLSGIVARIKYYKENKGTENFSFNNKCALEFESADDIDEILFSIDCMEGYEFEYFCADLLAKNGFSDVQVTQTSGDQGVDILAVKDELKYAIQCKNYSSHLGNTPVQEVCAGKMFYQCHIAAVITNTTFTAGAKELAKATGVLLWDRAVLEKFIKNSKH